jgi:hypothetical protein
MALIQLDHRHDMLFEGLDDDPYGQGIAISSKRPIPFPVPKERYSITVTGYEFKATEEVSITPDELDKRINTILVEGYSHEPTPTTRVIYPAHVICKIKVEKHQDIKL